MKNKKNILVFCELYLGVISIALLILMIYTLIFPMYINPNPDGSVIIYTNRYGELYFDWCIVIICLVIGIPSICYIIYYRFRGF